jgi:hypothetical protein
MGGLDVFVVVVDVTDAEGEDDSGVSAANATVRMRRRVTGATHACAHTALDCELLLPLLKGE